MIETLANPSLLLAFGLPGGWEWIAVLIIGLLIFGRRLPEVGRSIGRSIVEFKKGIKGIEDEIEQETNKPAERSTQKPASLADQSGGDSFQREKAQSPYASSE